MNKFPEKSRHNVMDLIIEALQEPHAAETSYHHVSKPLPILFRLPLNSGQKLSRERIDCFRPITEL